MRARFDAVRDALWHLLPRPVRRWVPATAIGYALINGFTFATDMAVMTLCHHVLALPYALSLSAGFVVGFGLAFVLNRALNFHSHGAVGAELVRYVAVIATNYAVLVVGLSTALVAVGVQYQLARLVAAALEAVFMYCALRWFVFAGRGVRTPGGRVPHHDAGAPPAG